MSVKEDILAQPLGDRLAELGEKLVDLALLGLVEAVGLALLEEAHDISP